MTGRERLEQGFKNLHDSLTTLFYKQREIADSEFLKLHTACWLLLEKELIIRGLSEDYPILDDTGQEIGNRSGEITAILPAVKDGDWKKHGLKTPAEIVSEYGVDLSR